VVTVLAGEERKADLKNSPIRRGIKNLILSERVRSGSASAGRKTTHSAISGIDEKRSGAPNQGNAEGAKVGTVRVSHADEKIGREGVAKQKWMQDPFGRESLLQKS